MLGYADNVQIFHQGRQAGTVNLYVEVGGGMGGCCQPGWWDRRWSIKIRYLELDIVG